MAHSLKRRFSCPVELSLEILDGKWKTVIRAHLKERPRRFAELRALIPSLSDKVLSQRLNDLEELGLALRHKRGGRGSRSVYELTARGESLRTVLQALYDWGELVAPSVGAIIEASR
jgi:DNA-binding HxlR family transcriptional regulator